MTYYCVVLGVHVYYSTCRKTAEAFRGRHAPKQDLLCTSYPHTYGFAHPISTRFYTPTNSQAP